MDKSVYLNYLFSNIKNHVEFDTDVIAINNILKALLKIDISSSIQNWLYILNKYDINFLKNDINFTPLLNNYPISLVKKISLKGLLKELNKLSQPKKIAISNFLFNIYEEESFLWLYLNDLILTKNTKDEKILINYLTKAEKYLSKTIFNLVDFLRFLITKHLKINNFDLKMLVSFTEIPQNLKDKSILKAFLIDYI